MLSKIDARWEELKEKRAAINREQIEETRALEVKINALEGSVKTREEQEEANIQQKVHQENAGKILCCAEGNNVVKFDPNSFDSSDPRNGRIEGQYGGNQFTLGIDLAGFILLLSIILWANYKRDESDFMGADGKCWNIGPLNGYDVCQHVKEYLREIGKLHQSLLEVIMEGKVKALKCLQEHVGLADAFFSHVQGLPVATMLETLEDAETRFAKELVHDPVATAALQEEALEEFLQKHESKEFLQKDGAASLIRGCDGKWDLITQYLQEEYGNVPAPALASITAQKDTGAPKFFIDYCGIRQCVKSDFTLERVVGAIEAIGTTVVELDADVLGPNALLRRIFCVLESFATIKAKGVLLVCGPGLQDPVQMRKLADLASDSVECKTVLDSLTAKCRWEEEAVKIKAYIQRTVGFSRTDKVVLAAIVSSILYSAESVFAEREDGGASVLRAIGCMVFEIGDYEKALELLKKALAKGEAAYGLEAAEIADTVYMLGKCKLMTGSLRPTECFEHDLRIQTKAYNEEHASTARSLVGMSKAYLAQSGWQDEKLTGGSTARSLVRLNVNLAKATECCERAIHRVQAAACLEDYADEYADALAQMGTIFLVKEEWQACLEWAQRSVEVRVAKHGQDHAMATDALGSIASAYGRIRPCDPKREMTLYLRVLEIFERTQGPLSREAGVIWRNIGGVKNTIGSYLEAAACYKQAVEAMEYTFGIASYETREYQGFFKNAIEPLDPSRPQDPGAPGVPRGVGGAGTGSGLAQRKRKQRRRKQRRRKLARKQRRLSLLRSAIGSSPEPEPGTPPPRAHPRRRVCAACASASAMAYALRAAGCSQPLQPGQGMKACGGSSALPRGTGQSKPPFRVPRGRPTDGSAAANTRHARGLQE
jgi:tetratricopeptide (TPR) repeat protein